MKEESKSELSANQYQKDACRTLIDKPDFELSQQEKGLLYPIFLINKDASRLAEIAKKGIFHRKGMPINDMKALEYLGLGKSNFKNNFSNFSDEEIMLIWNVLGLIGETGEIAEMVLEETLEGKGMPDKEKVKAELGDVLWYVSATAKVCGLTLEEIMQHNTDKLKARYPDGYSHNRSNNKEGKASI